MSYYLYVIDLSQLLMSYSESRLLRRVRHRRKAVRHEP